MTTARWTTILLGSLALLLLAPRVFAQDEITAAGLLEAAQEAHGGVALRDMATYRESGVVTVFGPSEEAVAQVLGVTLVDFDVLGYRDEVWSGQALVVISQTTPDGTVTWTPDTGALRLPSTQAEELRSSFYRGLFGLRWEDEWESAELLGEDALEGAEGYAVRVTTEGVETTYLLADDGRLLAQRYTSPSQGEVTVVYGDLRTVDGVSIPYVSDYVVEGRRFLRLELLDAQPNAELAPDAFQLPDDASP